MTLPSGALKITRLRCEALTNPLAVGNSQPILSWIVESEERGQRQTAYQILVSSSHDLLARDCGDLWDSGKTVSDETLNILYKGNPLKTAQCCCWKVRVWDRYDCFSEWSEVAFFGAGLKSSDWVADWIGFNKIRELDLPAAPFDGANWIWLAGEEAQSSSGVFIGTLQLPEDVQIEHSELAISVAGRYSFFWGAEQFGMSDNDPEPWRRPYIRHMNERLHPRANQFLIRADRIGDEPVGVLFKITVRTRDGRIFTLVSDKTWRGTSEIKPDWHTASGNENWPPCGIVAKYGAEPWGIVRGMDNFLPPPAYLRGTFELETSVRRATLFATALGWFDAHLNGARVNETYFDPGWTDYTRRLYYRAYDVTALVKQGTNTLGAVLADGWFSGYIGWCKQRDIYGKHPRFRAQIHVEYADGTSQVVKTDSTWKATVGPIKEADILMGETFDARQELTGWNTPEFDASDWEYVDVGASINPTLEPHPAPPIVALEKEQFVPRKITEPKPGVFIFNLGQNFAGVVKLKIRSASAGQKITIRHGERLNEDGTLYTVNLRTARATDTYVCRGEPVETWSPRFTFHGFQYVEVSGLSMKPDSGTIVGIPLSCDTPIVGSFHTSDELTNRLANNIYWSQRSNFIEVPTDCPQRDERLGWLDGAWTFIRAAVARADVQTFFNKFDVDLDDAQSPDGQFPWVAPRVVATFEHNGPFWDGSSPAWMDAGVICPWQIHDAYGDTRQLAEHYPAMVRQVEWYRKNSREDLLPPEKFKCLGDWLNHNGHVPLDVFRTAFFAYTTEIVSKSAEVLGKADDARRYRELSEQVKAAFRKAYVTADGRIKGDVQGCYALALEFRLLDDSQEAKAAAHLVERLHETDCLPTTGLELTLPMMRSLAHIGRNDLAYCLLHNERFPSWNFSIKNGATTIWERWNSWTPKDGFGDANMNSFNHFTLGGVFQWMFENIGGIQNASPSYKKIIIAPTPGGRVTHAQASYNSVRGLIESAWSITSSGLFLAIRIPANTTAILVLPTSNVEHITEGGLPLNESDTLTIEGQENGRILLSATSGSFQFMISPFFGFPVITPAQLGRCDNDLQPAST